MLGPLFAVFTERVGGDILDISWAWATYLIATGLCIILVGKLSDRYSREKLMIAGYALNAIGTFGYLFVQSPLHLLLVQGVLGIAAALATPTWEALYAKYESKKSPGNDWGIVSGESRIVAAIAILAGGFIVSNYSFELLFIVMGSIQVLATFYQARILTKKQASKGLFNFQ